MPTAARTRPWHARLLGPYATSDSDGNPGRVPKPSHDADRRAKPADPHALAGRWPRSRFAGNRARTLGARLYAASEALPVAPRAELASSNQVPVTHVARKAQTHLEPAPARIGRRAGETKCLDHRREELLRPSADGCQATTESDMGALRARRRSSGGRGMSFPRCSRPRAEAERRSPRSTSGPPLYRRRPAPVSPAARPTPRR